MECESSDDETFSTEDASQFMHLYPSPEKSESPKSKIDCSVYFDPDDEEEQRKKFLRLA